MRKAEEAEEEFQIDTSYLQSLVTSSYLKAGKKLVDKSSMYRPGKEYSGVITRVAERFAKVDVGLPQEGYISAARMRDTGKVENVKDFLKVGQFVKLYLVDVDEQNNPSFAMTPRKVFYLRQEDKAPMNEFQEINPLDWHEGFVATVTGAGVFVQIKSPISGKSAQGLVPSSLLPTPPPVLGDPVRVRLVRVDATANRMQLTMLQEGEGPSISTLKKGDKADVSEFQGISPADWHDGVVVTAQDYGVFVEIKSPVSGKPAQGLVPIRSIPATAPAVGDAVKVRLTRVDAEKNRFSLSMKEEADDEVIASAPAKDTVSRKERADVTEFEGISPSDWHDAVVTGSQDFGMFVKITSPVSGKPGEGLVPLRYLKSPAPAVGEAVKVRLLEVDTEKGRMSLSMKAEGDDTRRAIKEDRADLSELQGISPSEWIDGVVISSQSFGVFVQIKSPSSGKPCQGLLPQSLLPASPPSVGDVVKVRLLRVDLEQKRLAFTMQEESSESESRGPRREPPSPEDVEYLRKLSPDEYIEGIVARFIDTGAFVQLKPNLDGLLGVGQILTKSGAKVEDPAEVLEEGQKVKVRVLEVLDGEKGRVKVKLSMRPPQAPNVAAEEPQAEQS